ncbi:hypothetical protein [Streptomyces sp. NPDC048256]|uniref:hypothetical protein n=1 Tax=unclassified Streptomyces TaxID=2593676 RepID=UPI003252925A
MSGHGAGAGGGQGGGAADVLEAAGGVVASEQQGLRRIDRPGYGGDDGVVRVS